jgi:signal transduction histidine kinase/DNA-binding NarL/FixJ family response regulator/HPt (histidine-containing phosphotransfer) domain-containing protein
MDTRRRFQALMAAMTVLLVTALGAVGLLQARQIELLNATARYQDDYLVWSLFQFELEYQKLKTQLLEVSDQRSIKRAEAAAQRYEIFISRLNLIEGAHAAKVLQGEPGYQRTLSLSRAFVKWADALPLDASRIASDADAVRDALTRLEPMAGPARDLSLAASHHVAAQVTSRHELVGEQSQLSLALTLLQCALLLAFAVIIVRQFRSLERRNHEQAALAQRLGLAQQAAEAGSRAKSAFLANMSHELRTPMHGLLGMLSLLRETPMSVTQRAQFQAASDSARHLLNLLNDILDLSKMEAGAIRINPEAVQLRRLVQELEELTWPQAQAKGLDLALRVDADVPAWVQADPTRLRQILLNLLSNAVKFSDRGRVALRLSRAPDGEPLRFEVSDTGIGMDEATQAQLFQRFNQADQSSSRRFGGAGLGLEISRNLARAMGGDITVNSAPGRGSVFTVELPLPTCPAAAELPSAHLPSASGAQARSLHILVSEDHPTNRSFLEAALERLGHQAVFCDNGFDALQTLKQQDFDLVLMDLHTPVMDGYQSAQAMRALPGAKAAVKIIALSADAFEESRQRAIDAGMDGFIIKPVGIEALGEHLSRLSLSMANTGSLVRHGTHPTALRPAFDEALFQELRRNLPMERIRELYRGFADSLQHTIQDLQQASKAANAAALQSTAHSIKGASGSLGLLDVADAAAQLETAARQGATSDLLSRRSAALTDALTISLQLCAERGLL